MRRLFVMMVACLLVFALVLPSAAQEENGAGDVSPASGTILEVVQSGDFPLLAQAIDAADPALREDLSSGGPYTLFAPTDEAFSRLAEFFEFDLDDLLDDTELLSRLLRYHLIQGNISSELAGQLLVNSGREELLVPTLLDQTGLGLSFVDATLTINRIVEVTQSDIEADNGIVHAINDVIFPGSLRGQLENLRGSRPGGVTASTASSDFTVLLAVIQATGAGDRFETDGSVTIFAPTDEAFNALFDELGVSVNMMLGLPELLKPLLLYHVVEGKIMTGDIMAQDGGTLVTLQGETLQASAGDDSLLLTAPNRSAALIETNITAANGVIHAIDSVLIPQQTIDELAALGIRLDSTEPPGDDESLETLAELLAGDQTFSPLLSVIMATDTLKTFEAGGPVTVFAPSPAAFDRALGESGIMLETALAVPDLLEPILMFHVVTGELRIDDLMALDGTEITTLQGEALLVGVDGDQITLTAPSGTVLMLSHDMTARNGVIHIIDDVLIPQHTLDQLAVLGIRPGE